MPSLLLIHSHSHAHLPHSPHPHPFTCGMPLPQGQADPRQAWQLIDEQGNAQACQTSPMRLWPDGSVRWLKIEALWPRGCAKMELRARETAPLPPPIPPAWSLAAAPEKAPASSRLDLSAGAFRLPLTLILKDAAGKTVDLPLRLAGQTQDAFQNLYVLAGSPNASGPLGELRLQVRVHAYTGTGLCRLETTWWNPERARHPQGIWDLGDAGSLYFRHCGWEFPKAGNDSALLRVEPDQNAWPVGEGETWVHQSSAGFAAWDHITHSDKDGRPTPKFRGYRYQAGDGSGTGEQAQPVLAISRDGMACAFFCEDFWERFPGYMGQGGNTQSPAWRFSSFPEEDGQIFELQGGEKARSVLWLSSAPTPEAAMAQLWGPVSKADMAPAPEALRGNLGAFFPLHAAWPTALEEMAQRAMAGDRGLPRRRIDFQEFGWRNFGDIPADHEEQNYRDSRPLVSHYNNQYDLILGMFGRYLASGDGSWVRHADELAVHAYHHDLYHTTRDKSAYNGGYFWHTAHYLHAGRATHRAYSAFAKGGGPAGPGFGGGPSNEHNYSTGFLLHHFLTGSQASADAVMQLAHWVVAMQDGSKTPFRFLSRNATGLATRTRDEDFQGPGRGAGNSLCALLDAYALSDDRAWLSHADALVRACIHPEDDREGMGLLNHEDRWSYTVFLQNLARYLEINREARRSEDGGDGGQGGAMALARASLLAYAEWMAKNEYPNLAKPETLEFPTSTWAFQDLRKACVFAWAARYAAPDEFEKYRDKSNEYISACFHYLPVYPGADWIRNVALLFACSPVLAALESQGKAWNLGERPVPQAFPPRLILIPQKTDALRKARRIVKTAGLAAIPLMAGYFMEKFRAKP